jgi:septal ring factor EnvC (AmiA/AmiB activator)
MHARACDNAFRKRDGGSIYSIEESTMFGQIDDGGGISGWIVAAGAAVYGTLTTALAAMFKISETKSQKAIETLELRLKNYENKIEESDRKHEDCLEDRVQLRESIARLEGKLAAYIKDHDGN